MRTDSTRLSDVFVKDTFEFIKNNYGKNYVGYVKKTKEKRKMYKMHMKVLDQQALKEPQKVLSLI